MVRGLWREISLSYPPIPDSSDYIDSKTENGQDLAKLHHGGRPPYVIGGKHNHRSPNHKSGSDVDQPHAHTSRSQSFLDQFFTDEQILLSHKPIAFATDNLNWSFLKNQVGD